MKQLSQIHEAIFHLKLFAIAPSCDREGKPLRVGDMHTGHGDLPPIDSGNFPPLVMLAYLH